MFEVEKSQHPDLREFIEYVERLRSELQRLDAGTAPDDADYLVGTVPPELSDARAVTNTTSITWDLATANQAKAKRAALSGDVTASADSNTTTIANDAVTFAKIQNISTDRIVGRDTARHA